MLFRLDYALSCAILIGKSQSLFHLAPSLQQTRSVTMMMTTALTTKRVLTKLVKDSVTIEKKSRFIAFSQSVKSPDEALQFISTFGDPKASHNCWAYRLSGHLYRVDDDGEPGGTAGRPILTAIDSLQFTSIVVLVTRYYGGTKLGTGGLIRAYQNSAKTVLQHAVDSGAFIWQAPTTTLRMITTPDLMSLVYRTVDQFGGKIILNGSVEQAMDVLQIMDCEIAEEKSAAFTTTISEVSRGLITPTFIS
jgi:putative IMPACT (imprinted ancient) family translation regulator